MPMKSSDNEFCVATIGPVNAVGTCLISKFTIGSSAVKPGMMKKKI